ncbi:YcxB family protein [Brevundimonas sp. FT23028]|uniref:YcxB family protein n=1 Tax=Brevundimonas sp. FT23028 TaxID=3393748 RepID=UPI003B58769A
MRFSPAIEWVGRGADVLVLALPYALVIFAWVGGRHVVLWMAVALLFVVVVQRIAVAILKRLIAREWRQSPAGRLPKTWALDEGGVTISDEVSTYIIRWGGVTAVREEKRRFVFYVGPGTAYRLPIRFLDAGRNQIADIRALIAEVTASGRLGRGVD